MFAFHTGGVEGSLDGSLIIGLCLGGVLRDLRVVLGQEEVDFRQGNQVNRGIVLHVRTAEHSGLVVVGGAHVVAGYAAPILLVAVLGEESAKAVVVIIGHGPEKGDVQGDVDLGGTEVGCKLFLIERIGLSGFIGYEALESDVFGREVAFVHEGRQLGIHAGDGALTHEELEFEGVGELDPRRSVLTRIEQVGSDSRLERSLVEGFVQFGDEAGVDILAVVKLGVQVVLALLSLGIRGLAVGVDEGLIREDADAGGGQVAAPGTFFGSLVADEGRVADGSTVQIRIGTVRRGGSNLELAVGNIVARSEIVGVLLGEVTAENTEQVTVAGAERHFRGRKGHVHGRQFLTRRVRRVVDIQIILAGREGKDGNRCNDGKYLFHVRILL